MIEGCLRPDTESPGQQGILSEGQLRFRSKRPPLFSTSGMMPSGQQNCCRRGVLTSEVHNHLVSQDLELVATGCNLFMVRGKEVMAGHKVQVGVPARVGPLQVIGVLIQGSQNSLILPACSKRRSCLSN